MNEPIGTHFEIVLEGKPPRSYRDVKARHHQGRNLPETVAPHNRSERAGLGDYVSDKYRPSDDGRLTHDRTTMPDDAIPSDPQRIDVHDVDEVRYWAKKFGCSETQLRAAANPVGLTSYKVEAYVRTRRRLLGDKLG